MVRLLSLLILILSIVLAPPAALAVISNNAVPGDRTYPIKRYLEGAIISLSSLHPATRAYFQVDFTKRRYREATTLLLRNSVEAGKSLGALVSQTNTAVDDISTLSNKKRKTELVKSLIKNINTYNKGLTEIGPATSGNTKSSPTPIPIPTPSPTPVPSTPSSSGQHSTPTPTPAPILKPVVDKCESDEPKSNAETIECLDKAKYKACAEDGHNRAQCDELAKQEEAQATSNPSPSSTTTSAALARREEIAAAAGGETAVAPSPSSDDTQFLADTGRSTGGRNAAAVVGSSPTPAPVVDNARPTGYEVYPETASGANNACTQTSGAIAGWACDSDAPNTPIWVDFHVDGAHVGQAIANTNWDGSSLCGGGPNHGFTFNLSDSTTNLRDGQPHQIEAFAHNIDSNGAQISGSQPNLYDYNAQLKAISNGETQANNKLTVTCQ